jgi:hypothetical protein
LRAPETFPNIDGKDLEGKNVRIPKNLHGDLNVLIVAFEQWQQEQVDSWVGFLRGLKEKFHGFDFYELPTLGSEYRLARFFIDGGMRAGIPSNATRRHTVTLYLDKRDFKRALGIENEKSIRLYAIGRDGRVYWCGSGPFDAETASGLERIVVGVDLPPGPGTD